MVSGTVEHQKCMKISICEWSYTYIYIDSYICTYIYRHTYMNNQWMINKTKQSLTKNKKRKCISYKANVMAGRTTAVHRPNFVCIWFMFCNFDCLIIRLISRIANWIHSILCFIYLMVAWLSSSTCWFMVILIHCWWGGVFLRFCSWGSLGLCWVLPLGPLLGPFLGFGSFPWAPLGSLLGCSLGPLLSPSIEHLLSPILGALPWALVGRFHWALVGPTPEA